MNAESPDAGPVLYFTADHRACDDLWAALEAAPSAAAWAAFDHATRRHFDMEELVLFPAFEEATGMTQGPTAVMRMEHRQMRGLLDQMGAAAAAGDWDALLDQGDTLLMITQQHNVKEEGMLYPMAEAHLGGQWPTVAAKLARYGTQRFG